MLVGFGEKWILTEHIFLVVKPARESRRLLWCMDGGVLFKRANLLWALLWNDNSLSCCRWSRRSFGQQGQSESNMRALCRFTGPTVPMPRCCRSCQKCRLQGVRGGEDLIPAGRGMVFLSRLWRIYGCLRVFAPSFEFGCLSELNWVFVCTSSSCVVFPWRTQVCVITAVIRPGYGPPASDWTLSSPAWLTTKEANTSWFCLWWRC